jgi:hypothetical protein
MRLSYLLALLVLTAPSFALAQSDDEEDEFDRLDTPQQQDPEPEVADGGAEEDPEPEVATPTSNMWDRIFALSVTVGIDTPFGIAGLAAEVTPFQYLAIYAGVGIGRDGVRVAGGLRPQFPMGNAALGILLGLAGGPLDWDSRGGDAQETHRWWEFALFFHTGISFEYRFDEGLFGRLEFGVEALIEPTEATTCRFEGGGMCGTSGLAAPVRGWAGLTAGYAF